MLILVEPVSPPSLFLVLDFMCCYIKEAAPSSLICTQVLYLGSLQPLCPCSKYAQRSTNYKLSLFADYLETDTQTQNFLPNSSWLISCSFS
jgi:hypothetical protein